MIRRYGVCRDLGSLAWAAARANVSGSTGRRRVEQIGHDGGVAAGSQRVRHPAPCRGTNDGTVHEDELHDLMMPPRSRHSDPALGGFGSLDRGALDLVPISRPPSLVARWKVGPAAISPDLAVDQLAKDIGVAGMAIDVDDHVD